MKTKNYRRVNIFNSNDGCSSDGYPTVPTNTFKHWVDFPVCFISFQNSFVDISWVLHRWNPGASFTNHPRSGPIAWFPLHELESIQTSHVAQPICKVLLALYTFLRIVLCSCFLFELRKQYYRHPIMCQLKTDIHQRSMNIK